MDDTKRAVYQRLVQASLLLDEAAAEARRAVHIGVGARELLTRIASGDADVAQIAAALDKMYASIHKSSACTREASALITA